MRARVEEQAAALAAVWKSLGLPSEPAADEVCYKIVTFIDGVRTVTEIRDAVSAEFEPIDIKAVSEYLDLLARIGAISLK